MPKSEKRHRMIENMDVFSFVIDDADMTALGNMYEKGSILPVSGTKTVPFLGVHLLVLFVALLCWGWLAPES